MKKEAVHTPGRTPGESIARLHEEMCNLVGNDMNVNIEQDEERLLFRLWKCHEWGELTLYYFPTKFMERLGPEMRRISVTFIHNLMQANGINTVLDEDDMDYALTLMSEDDSGETASDRKRGGGSCTPMRKAGYMPCYAGWNANPITRICRRQSTDISRRTGTNSHCSLS